MFIFEVTLRPNGDIVFVYIEVQPVLTNAALYDHEPVAGISGGCNTTKQKMAPFCGKVVIQRRLYDLVRTTQLTDETKLRAFPWHYDTHYGASL